MNIYQLFANEIREHNFKCPTVIDLRSIHHRDEYPVWNMKWHELEDHGSSFEIEIERWLSMSAYNRLHKHITCLSDLVAIYDALRPKTSEYTQEDFGTFISWLIRSSETFRSMHDWSYFQHNFFLLSDLEKIIDQIVVIIPDTELIQALTI